MSRSEHSVVRIHYRRIPDRENVYVQRVVLERPDVIVTLSEPVRLAGPMTHDGAVMLETGALAVWFTFPGRWYDIGRFHAADGRFTGIYANVLTPCEIDGSVWRTTDLFADVWWPHGGEPTVLDLDELGRAEESGTLDPTTAARARREAADLVAAAADGAWPPDVVHEWTLERCLAELEPASR